jgi:hypothetical protein
VTVKRIGIITGYWSTNIGNSFFQLGAMHVLKQIFPNDLVFAVGDQAGYAFPQHGTPANSLDVTASLDLDYLVILGPFIRPEFESLLLPTMKALAKRGTKFILMGIGMMKYDAATISMVKSALKELPIEVFVTRDRQTYEAFSDVSQHSFDGVDIAFFVADTWPREVKPNLGRYIVLNFDQLPEPDFVEVSGSSGNHLVIPLGEKNYELQMSGWRRTLSEKGTLFNILERTYVKRKPVTQIGEFNVVRTDHRYNPVLLKKIYNAPSTYSADVPYSYLALYNGCEVTISNRVHACVATMAFGNKAMLISKTPRAFLLDRAGASTIKEKPTALDMDALAEEKRRYVEFLGEALKV